MSVRERILRTLTPNIRFKLPWINTDGNAKWFVSVCIFALDRERCDKTLAVLILRDTLRALP
jgi:hypothetical protein